MVFLWFSSGNQAAVKIRERRADGSGGHVLIQFPAQLPPGAAPMSHGCHGCHGWLGDLRGKNIWDMFIYICVYDIYVYVCVYDIYIL
jgi:hypothetical protein